MEHISIYIISLGLGSAGAWVINRYGAQIGLIDIPNERSSHQIPTPKGGGIGILAAFILLAFIYPPIHWTFWLPATGLAVLSLFADLTNIGPKIRLFFQFSVGFFVLFNMLTEQNLLILILLVFVLSFYLVGTSNFYNFMDGINGIAGITGVVGFGLLAVHNTIYGDNPLFTYFNLGIAFACLGFLPWNIPQARVFMGDVGSILLGFAFGGIVILMAQDWLDILCLPAFLFTVYADELTTMVARIRRKESLIQPHRTHLYQILVNEKKNLTGRYHLSMGCYNFQLGSVF